MWETLYADLCAVQDWPVATTPAARLRVAVRGLLTVRGVAVAGFRLSHAADGRSAALGSLVKQLTHVLTGCDIGPRARIGPGLRLLHPTGVTIANDTVVGTRCTIHQGVTLGSDPRGCPVIGDGVNLGPGARVLGPVRIGDRCHVGANAVMTRTIEGDDLVLAGVPARVLRANGAATV